MRMKALYHRIVPEGVRTPIGRGRRLFADQLRRLVANPPLPPRRLLATIQTTPFLNEYLSVGRRGASTVLEVLEERGFDRAGRHRILDFGCGPARTLRHLMNTGWELHGCDVNSESIAWASRAIPAIRFRTNSEAPPLPYEDAAFDAVIAISLFTHFDRNDQEAWAAEMARIVRPAGIVIVSTMGRWHLEQFRPEQCEMDQLEREGFVFRRREGGFNESGAFHTAEAIAKLFAPHFTLESSRPAGLDGFQDLNVLRRS
jgi:SAM-dependent methyltransferase